MKILNIQCAASYPVYIGHEVLSSDEFYATLRELNLRIALITDSNLHAGLGEKIRCELQQHGFLVDLLFFPAGELHKTRATKQVLEDTLFEKNYGRDTCLIALGGGVVTDLVGFLAATYARGVPVIYLPTSLMGMVDASLGGKTGVNTSSGKNLIGTITQPHAVFIDTTVLSTLSDHEFLQGIVEMIKHGMIADRAFFNALSSNVYALKHRDPGCLIEMIYTSCSIKKNIIEQDENENGMRHALNFGHTIGHAIELLENYHIAHGQAVAIGMLVECYLSVLSGRLEPAVLTLLSNLLGSFNVPLTTTAFNNPDAFRQALVLDKKAKSNIPHFVLLDCVGQVKCVAGIYVSRVTDDVLDRALHWATVKFSPLT